DMAEYARQLGLDPARLQPFEPWVAALALAQAQMVALGLSHDAGVEQVFLARALEDRKEVLGLETPQDGLGALANLPLPRQREFIEYTLSEADTVAAELDDMLVAWRRGDTETLARLLEHGFREFPDLYGPLTVERNRRWVAVLDDLLEEPDDYLVVVGALHLVGEESLIDLLEAQGLNVVRR
ncbi:MAG TPA: TraB/GumN family protein, partial [Steroidobacteraceae bacterium]|nr:TraB/GumN family protein [Steroidobacteraceae bacterium]